LPKREIKPIFVRLTGAERKRIRTLAVSQGLTMQQAIVQAFEAWASQLRLRAKGSASPRAATGGSRPMGGRPKKHLEPEEASTGTQVRRPADVESSEEGPSLAEVPGLEALTGDWPGGAAQLDWSKCPEAESVQTKRGTIWVAAGTLKPLVQIFDAVANGHPLAEIAEVYDLTLQQLMALLQFAAEGGAGSNSER